MPCPVVTAIDRAYLPGLKALNNSFKANAGPGFELHCMVYGDQALRDEVAALGVRAINPPDWHVRYPTTEKWPDESPAMYARLLIPKLFAERAIWIDADCIIMEPLAELAGLCFTEPVAAVHFANEHYTLGFHIRELKDKTPVPFSGLLVFNIPRWNELRITERCAEAMTNGMDFRFVVQSVLGLVLMGDYYRLGEEWQVFAGRKKIRPDAKILHWVGGLPWRERMNHQELWEAYA